MTSAVRHRRGLKQKDTDEMRDIGAIAVSASAQGAAALDEPVAAMAAKTYLVRIDATNATAMRRWIMAAAKAFQGERGCFLIILDLDGSGSAGSPLARQVSHLGIAGRCVVISRLDRPQGRAEAAALGLLGYIDKSSSIDDVTASFSAVIGDRFPPAAAVLPDPPPAIHLTRRQHDILRLLQRGYTSKEIARQLALSTGTVDNHVAAVLRALQVTNRTHAIVKAMELGLIGAAEPAAIPRDQSAPAFPPSHFPSSDTQGMDQP